MQNEHEVTPEIMEESATVELENLPHELRNREAVIARLETTLAEKDAEIAAVKQSAAEYQSQLETVSQSLTEAVTAYRELTVQACPGLLPEMVRGESIAAVQASVKTAQELLDKVRQSVGAENARVRVPAGAPPRTAPDLSALSAREKIRYGMEG